MSQAFAVDEAYLHAIDQLYALGQELAPAAALPDGTPAPRRKWDLAHMRTLCLALGNLQQAFPSVLIAGTNGKGSTAATLASILACAGYKTALYTSPHLVRVNERIQIFPPLLAPASTLASTLQSTPLSPFAAVAGSASLAAGTASRPALAPRTTHPLPAQTEIADEVFARLFAKVDDSASSLVKSGALPHPPSFFEVITALAFLYFAEEHVDIAILEVGLGGRLDATNIVDPLLSILTDIALDHQDYLGDTIAEITREKAGILRHNGTLITLPQHPEANQAIGHAAALLNLTAISAADFIPPQVPALHRPKPNAATQPTPDEDTLSSPLRALSSFAGGEGSASSLPAAAIAPRNCYTLSLNGERLDVDSPLPGHHQQRNIALAIAACLALRNRKGSSPEISNQSSYNIANSAIEAGIRLTRWPGRLEYLFPGLLLDVAHNPAGVWTLRAAIAQLSEDCPRTLIFSCLNDKNLTEMSRILFPLFDASPGGGRPNDHIILAPIANPRAARVEDLIAAAHALEIPAHAAPHAEGALAQARSITPPGGLIIATGSVYLVGAIRALVLEQGSTLS